jgi:drug/metabolite transporter (DMT)-like permease
MPQNSASASQKTWILIAFGCVYFFWGSTYVAIRFGVEVLPPFVLASVRFLIAGPLMLALCAVRGMSLRVTRRELGLLAAIGILMLGGGNMGLVWCEQYLSSGLAALIIAVIPLYVAVFEALLPHGEGLRAKGWVGVCIGFAGLLVLLSPGLRESLHGDMRQLIGAAVALGCALSWTAGSILSRHAKLPVSPFLAAAWEMLFAGLFNGVVMLMAGGFRGSHWGVQAWSSILYLVTFGSLVGYTAYIYLLEHVPVAKVSTYAYINPVVAVILGAIFLHERFVAIEYVGMGAILLAVFLVTSSKLKSGATVAEAECVAASISRKQAY